MDSVLSNQMEYNTKKNTVAVALSTLKFKGEVCNFSYVEIISLLPSYCAETITNKPFFGGNWVLCRVLLYKVLFVWEAWQNNIGSINVSVSEVGPIYLPSKRVKKTCMDIDLKLLLQFSLVTIVAQAHFTFKERAKTTILRVRGYGAVNDILKVLQGRKWTQ